jgi:fumarylpyruvate hydrolase
MSYVLPPPPQVSVAVAGTADRFPVRRIFCVGRNYAAHAREMGKDPDREPPFFFMKPADAVVDSGTTIPYPPQTKELHYEMELVVALGQGGIDVPRETALDLVFGYGCGIDLTRRDLQAQAKEMGRPWDFGKGFDNSAPCGPIHRVASTGHPEKGRIWLAGEAGWRPCGADLAGAGHHRHPVALDAACAGRPHLHRDAGRCRRREGGRQDHRRGRRARRDRDRDRLA